MTSVQLVGQWAFSDFVYILIFCLYRAYEEHAGEVIRLLKSLGVPTMDRDISGMTPQDLSPGIEC